MRAILAGQQPVELSAIWATLASVELHALVKSLIQRVEVGDAEISVRLNRTAVVLNVMPEAALKQIECKSAAEPAALSIDASLRRAGKGTRLVIGDGSANQIDNGLTSLITRAIATRNMLLAGADDSIEAMASRLGMRRDYLTVLVRLSYLSPEVVRAILAGQHPVELSATRLVKLSKDLPHDWHQQRRVLGFSAA